MKCEVDEAEQPAQVLPDDYNKVFRRYQVGNEKSTLFGLKHMN